MSKLPHWLARRRVALCQPPGVGEYGSVAVACALWALVLVRGLSPWIVAAALGTFALFCAAAAVLVSGRGTHLYLSTGCRHGQHEHCRSTVAASGAAKTPGTCKFCTAVCVCWCHEWNGGSGTETK